MKRLLHMEARKTLANIYPIPESLINVQIGTENKQLMFRGTNYDNKVIEIWRDKDNDKLYTFEAPIEDQDGLQVINEANLLEVSNLSDTGTARQIRDEHGPYLANE